jgi:transcriptional regulator GlxA family with amidase domain
MPSPRRVVVVIYPGIQPLDAVGPLEVLSTANGYERFAGRPEPYRFELVAPEAGPQLTQSGYQLVAERSYRALRGPIDTLLVAGGAGSRRVRHDQALLAWLKRQAPRVRRLCSVCTGSLILAEAGLLDGKRATTHWGSCAHMAERYPRVRVEADPIFVRDGSVYTSAGVTAGIDLTLALVEEDCGAALARAVAKQLVVFLQRPGGQAQFSAQLAAQAPEVDAFRELHAFIVDHPERDLSVEALAARVAMSPRNFARRFREQVGLTPGQFVRKTRLQSAQRRLEQGKESVERIAERCGFGTSESMRRTFAQLVHVAPRHYRQRFSKGAAS